MRFVIPKPCFTLSSASGIASLPVRVCSPAVSPIISLVIRKGYRAFFAVLCVALVSLAGAPAFAQSPASHPESITVEGTVRNSAGEPIVGASVVLEQSNIASPVETTTLGNGTFVLSVHLAGNYALRVEKAGFRPAVTDSLTISAGEKKHVNVVLHTEGEARPSSAGSTPSLSSPEAMEFDDKPTFAVAGVTDPSAAGGHGSDVSLRTSEALARETLTLKAGGSHKISTGPAAASAKGHASGESESQLQAALAQAPQSFEANHRLGEFYFFSERYREATPLLEAAYRINPESHANAYDLALAYRESGDLTRAREQARKMLASDSQGKQDKTAKDKAEVHRLLGDLDERSGDPVKAVHEYEEAVRLDASEQNYFEWGTELLLHKAIPQAVEVFSKGAAAHSESERMLAGLGVALYGAGSDEEAARRLCQASDLNPADPAPYVFLGRMDKAASAPLPCAEQTLARFARDQPTNALANYYYAMTLWKREKASGSPTGSPPIEALLKRAVEIDSNLGEAHLQLGALYYARGDDSRAVLAYLKAIEVSPELAEPHYRLGLVYKRMGEKSKAQQEFQLQAQLKTAEEAAFERQRHELQQFVITLKDQPAGSPQH